MTGLKMEESSTNKDLPTPDSSLMSKNMMKRVLAQNYLGDTIERKDEDEHDKPNVVVFDYKIDPDFF